jgi:hypothetical protein
VFSFFPDGRIMRADFVDNAGTHDVANCTPCGGAGGTFVLSSYTTLIIDSNAFFTDGASQNAAHGAEAPPGDSTCMSERGTAFAFSWGPVATRLRVAAAPPTSPSRTVAFVRDIVRDTTLAQGQYASFTQMGISNEACGVLEGRITPFSDTDHQLVITSGLGSSSVGQATTDGIYGGYPNNEGFPVDFPVTLAANNTTPQPNIPAGFAVWLYSQPLPTPLIVTHSRNPPGTWYREQRINQNSVILWFDVSLENGETIMVSGP